MDLSPVLKPSRTSVTLSWKVHLFACPQVPDSNHRNLFFTPTEVNVDVIKGETDRWMLMFWAGSMGHQMFGRDVPFADQLCADLFAGVGAHQGRELSWELTAPQEAIFNSEWRVDVEPFSAPGLFGSFDARQVLIASNSLGHATVYVFGDGPHSVTYSNQSLNPKTALNNAPDRVKRLVIEVTGCPELLV